MKKVTYGKVAIGLLAAAMVAGQVPVPVFAQAAAQAGAGSPVVVAGSADTAKNATLGDALTQTQNSVDPEPSDDPTNPRAKSLVIMNKSTAERPYDGDYQSVGARVVDKTSGQEIEGATIDFLYYSVPEGSNSDQHDGWQRLDEAPKDAGDYAIVAVFHQTDDHQMSYAIARLTITPRRMLMKFSAAPKISGEEDNPFLYEIVDLDAEAAPWKGAGGERYGAADELEDYFDPEDDITVGRYPAGEEPGDYAIEGTAIWRNPNFYLETENGVMRINPRLTVAANGQGTADAYDVYEDVERGGYTGGPEGETANLVAKPKAGYVFAGWTVDEGNATVADASSAKTTVTMGSKNAKVTAHFKAADNGAASNTKTTTTTKNGTKKDLPKTGDRTAAIVAAAGVAGVAVLGAGIAQVLKRRHQ